MSSAIYFSLLRNYVVVCFYEKWHGLQIYQCFELQISGVSSSHFQIRDQSRTQSTRPTLSPSPGSTMPGKQ